MNRITIVSISTGDSSLLTLGAAEAMQTAKRLYLRTQRHPIAAWLAEKQVVFKALDDLYETAETFDAFNQAAAKTLTDAAAESDVVFAVADATMDSTVTALLQSCAGSDAVVILPGVSHAERCLAMAKVGEQDVRRSAAETFLAGDDINPDISCFLSELHSQTCAGACKLKLMRLLDDQTQLCFFTGDPDGQLRMAEIPLYALDRQERYDHMTACLYTAQPMTQRKRFSVDDLFNVMKRLRAKDGCPWDQEQTHESLLPNLLEESYEYIDAVREQDAEHMCEELGDVLLQVMFHAVIAGQCGEFDLHDVTTAITSKLIVRHPHVFGTVKADTASQVLDNWEKIKRKQRGIDNVADAMDNVSTGMSATMRSVKVQHKAAKIGFDFPDAKEALDKVLEESREVLDCFVTNTDPQEELGDLLFSVVNVCRLCGVNPDIALYAAVNKFIHRFRGMETEALKDGKSLEGLTLREMDVYWLKEKHISMNDTD